MTAPDRSIPPAALALGLAGVAPFAALSGAKHLTAEAEPAMLAHSALQLYAVMILAFMSGCIWAFAARTGDATGYALSTLPALYGFFVPLLPVYLGWITPNETLALLAVGFIVLLALDRRAMQLGQTPGWWLRLRLLLTALVVACLIAGAMA